MHHLTYPNPSDLAPEKPLLGAHTSTQGGLYKAIEQGQAIGATTIQCFTSNQRQWKGRILNPSELACWHQTLEKYPMRCTMSHASYLINMGSNNELLLHKSRQAFAEEIDRCLQLGLTFLNFHPGARTGDSEEACLERIVQSLRSMEPLFARWTGLRLLLETTAGQGSTVGHTFEQLAYIVQRVQNHVPIGICLDTCHVFAAGYDIRTHQGWSDALQQFDAAVGLTHLHAMHLNDSIGALGSRKDRHANLGAGALGMECFRAMWSHKALHALPKYLETPGGPLSWKEEIKLLQEQAQKMAPKGVPGPCVAPEAK